MDHTSEVNSCNEIQHASYVNQVKFVLDSPYDNTKTMVCFNSIKNPLLFKTSLIQLTSLGLIFQGQGVKKTRQKIEPVVADYIEILRQIN